MVRTMIRRFSKVSNDGRHVTITSYSQPTAATFRALDVPADPLRRMPRAATVVDVHSARTSGCSRRDERAPNTRFRLFTLIRIPRTTVLVDFPRNRGESFSFAGIRRREGTQSPRSSECESTTNVAAAIRVTGMSLTECRCH